MAEVLTKPTRKYLYMTINKASSTKGRNDEIVLEELSDEQAIKILKLAEIGSIKESYNEIKYLLESGTGIFKEKKNPVNNRLQVYVRYHSMNDWDEIYEKYKKQGAEIQETEKKTSKKVTKSNLTEDGDYAPVEDDEVQEFLDFLRSYQKSVLEEAFTVSVTDVSQKRIDDAEDILKKLVAAVEDIENGGNGISVPMFNDLRHKLHGKIPRAIANVRKDDVKKKGEYKDKIVEEIAFFDFFKEQVELARSEEETEIFQGQTVLEANQLQMERLKDADEIERIKCMMGGNRGQVSRIFKVKNERTEKYFDNYCKKKGLTLENGGVNELFHGSGTENWWSIFSNGLYLKPEALGISICGKAFGHGIYFAPLAQKSLGYTSYCGSYWKGGNDNKAYLAIFKVATGEVYDIYAEGNGVPDNYAQLQQKHPGADCTWAYAGRTDTNGQGICRLHNDEVIVYTDGSVNKDGPEEAKVSQCTIEYLIEVDRNVGTLY